MNYYVLLNIPVPQTKFFLEVGISYELPFHPNLTDEIEVVGYPSKINRIYYNLDNLSYVKMNVEATDNLISIRNNPSNETIHQWLSHDWKELKEWANTNGERIVLNSYYMHPERPFNERL